MVYCIYLYLGYNFLHGYTEKVHLFTNINYLHLISDICQLPNLQITVHFWMSLWEVVKLLHDILRKLMLKILFIDHKKIDF